MHLLNMAILEEIVIEARDIEHTLEYGIPKLATTYIKQVFPMLLSPTKPMVLLELYE